MVLHAIIDWLGSTPERPDTEDLGEPIEGYRANCYWGNFLLCDHPSGEGADKSWPELFAQGNRSVSIGESSKESFMPWKDGPPYRWREDKLPFSKDKQGLSRNKIKTAPHQPGFEVL